MQKRQKIEIPEILAPVGSPEALTAAVRSGADAVYFGTGECNARRNAGKFEGEDLLRAVSYCHARNVKVYLTVNTLLWDDEIKDAVMTIEKIAESGADGMIIQDLAVARLAETICPDLPRHASTQMAVHNVSGVLELADKGFSRVVLARELTGKEIEMIRRHTDTEIEVFVHGALCMSASGMCYLSSSLGERSGNRGTCAQPCRLPFRCKNADYCMSLKDMSHLNYLRELSSIGVSSLKIEGRMKRPEYVAASVHSAVQARNGEAFNTDELESVFSRSGFTDGYYTGKRNRNMFGIRTQDDAEKSKDSFSGFRELYRSERASVPINATITLKRNEPCVLTVTDGTRWQTETGSIPQAAERLPATKESLLRSIGKTGGTPFYINDFQCTVDEGIMIPSGELNRMRRCALERLLAEREIITPYTVIPYEETFIPDRIRGERKQYRCRFLKAEQVFTDSRIDSYSLPVSELLLHRDMIGEDVCAEIPELVYPNEEENLFKQLIELKKLGIQSAVANTFGAVRLAQDAGMKVRGGYGLNITNSIAASEAAGYGLTDITLSFELPYSKMKDLKSPVPTGCIIAGKLPLMQMRSCPGRTAYGCGDCDGKPVITDRKHRSFDIVCHERRYSTLLNSVLYYTSDKELPPLDFYMVYYSLETAEKAKELFNCAVSREKIDGERTTGASFRVLL